MIDPDTPENVRRKTYRKVSDVPVNVSMSGVGHPCLIHDWIMWPELPMEYWDLLRLIEEYKSCFPL